MGIIMEYYLPVLRAREYDWQVRLLDINVLTELSAKYDTAEKFLAEFALDPPSRNFGTGTVALVDESEDLPLTISTIHSAKGLEWHSVIIPHALDGLIPSARSLKNIEEAERRETVYVACSRRNMTDNYLPSFVSSMMLSVIPAVFLPS
jgi:DNA helicase-2/ATP-dependent DNA helicase PcrA